MDNIVYDCKCKLVVGSGASVGAEEVMALVGFIVRVVAVTNRK